eukprot:CAMPEP_0181040406 /NCGR_PEP_ID=MMETSP1070-20121207/11030_1 /TAXON_ID=265543 /ORGANISM="Minutocellus polymorphus, Strain NH13" /LENGTH=1149 /DNA_ID=CAMNT_0023118411 /DNA_START=133 /DNA_END=3579 /DNA_ORIENTATION=+
MSRNFSSAAGSGGYAPSTAAAYGTSSHGPHSAYGGGGSSFGPSPGSVPAASGAQQPNQHQHQQQIASAASRRGAGGATQPGRIQFCPGRGDVYGSVNTSTSIVMGTAAKSPFDQEAADTHLAASAAAAAASTRGAMGGGSGGGGNKQTKPGPVLLELRRVQIESDPERRRRGQCWTSRTVGLGRGNPNLGWGVASRCLSFRPDAIAGSGGAASAAATASGDIVQCATGLSSGAVCLHTFRGLEDYLANMDGEAEGDDDDADGISAPDQPLQSEVTYFAGRHHRPATSVAWRPGPTKSELRHVAVGLAGSGGGDRGGTAHAGGAYQPRGRAVGGASTAQYGTGGAAGGMSNAGGAYGGSASGMGVGAQYTPGGGGGGGAAGGEFCCLIWDIERQASAPTAVLRSDRRAGGAGRVAAPEPIYKYAHNTPVSSLSWLSSGNHLAVGSQNRVIQLYDLRVKGTQPTSIYAHSDAVAGIEADPFRSNVFATFGRGMKEPVKLWDSRRMDACLGEIKMGDEETVSAAVWASQPNRSGMLTLAVGDVLKTYDTSASGSRPALVGFRHSPSDIQSMAFVPALSHRSESHCTDSDFYPHRILAVSGDSVVQDIATFQAAPLDISKRDGKIGFCLGQNAWIGAKGDVPTAMDGASDRTSGEDVSATMMRRAKALHSVRYSMEAGANLDVLREEKKASAVGSNTPDPFLKDGTNTVDDPKNEELIRVWKWIERVEGLCSAETGQMGEEWYAKGLVDAGVYRLLRMDTSSSSSSSAGDTVSKSSSFGCNIYASSRRRAALNACGLVGKFSLRDVLAEAEAQGNYERSAALAVFHGDLGAAVAALQRGVDRIKLTITEEKESGKPESEVAQSSVQYAETLQLVGMCVAGFRAPSTSEDTNSAAVWRLSCEGLLQQRQDLSSERARTANVPYLRAMLLFLLNVGKSDGPDKILQNETLSLSDRVAFACMFLSRADLQQYLLKSIEKCKDDGNLEGIIITGLDQRGFQILQSFVDIFSDCQTAALISSRVVLPSNWAIERAMCSEWLDNYRDLLNTFSMWQSRAMFDVGRAELLRNVRDQQAEDAATAPMPVGTMSRNASQGRRGYTAPQQGRARPQPNGKQQGEESTDIVANYPPQLYARCNYCNTSLPLSRLSRQENIASGW